MTVWYFNNSLTKLKSQLHFGEEKGFWALICFFFSHFTLAQSAQKIFLLIASTRTKLRSENQTGVYCTLHSLCQNVLLDQLLQSLVVRNVGTKTLKRKDKTLCDIWISRCLKDKGTTSPFDQTFTKLINSVRSKSLSKYQLCSSI